MNNNLGSPVQHPKLGYVTVHNALCQLPQTLPVVGGAFDDIT